MTKPRIQVAQPAQTFVDEGAAFMSLTGWGAQARTTPDSDASRTPDRIARATSAERLDVIVIGAGQAGLSVGYYLARRGLRFVILDGCERIGDQWRKRWDSLRLFTPARFDGLVGMPFPAPPDEFPTKDQMADYLAAYAAHFALPVRSAVQVDRLSRRNGRYVVSAGALELEAEHVVVAMATFQRPRVPTFARELDAKIVQLHSHAYRNPAQLTPGPVLIAGAGNSGAEIALELSRSHAIRMAGRDTGEIPFQIDSFLGRLFLGPLVLRFLFHRVLTVKTPLGRKLRAKILHVGGPLIRTKSRHLAAAGVERVARVVGVRGGLPLLEDGRTLDVANVVWCTGFDPGFSWIDLPVLDEHGEPRHTSGVAENEPGLYFVGLHFLHAASSTMIHGVGRDAERIAATIAQRVGAVRGAAGAELVPAV